MGTDAPVLAATQLPWSSWQVGNVASWLPHPHSMVIQKNPCLQGSCATIMLATTELGNSCQAQFWQCPVVANMAQGVI